MLRIRFVSTRGVMLGLVAVHWGFVTILVLFGYNSYKNALWYSFFFLGFLMHLTLGYFDIYVKIYGRLLLNRSRQYVVSLGLQ